MMGALRQRKAGAGLDLMGLIELLESLQQGGMGEMGEAAEKVPGVKNDDLPDEKKLDLAPEGAAMESDDDDEMAEQPDQEQDMDKIAQMIGANGSKGGLSNKVAEYWQRMKGK